MCLGCGVGCWYKLARRLGVVMAYGLSHMHGPPLDWALSIGRVFLILRREGA